MGSLLSLCVVASSRFELSGRLLCKSWFPQQPPVPVHPSLLSLLLAILLPSVTQARSTPVKACEIGMTRLVPNNAGKTHFLGVIYIGHAHLLVCSKLWIIRTTAIAGVVPHWAKYIGPSVVLGTDRERHVQMLVLLLSLVTIHRITISIKPRLSINQPQPRLPVPVPASASTLAGSLFCTTLCLSSGICTRIRLQFCWNASESRYLSVCNGFLEVLWLHDFCRMYGRWIWICCVSSVDGMSVEES